MKNEITVLDMGTGAEYFLRDTTGKTIHWMSEKILNEKKEAWQEKVTTSNAVV